MVRKGSCLLPTPCRALRLPGARHIAQEVGKRKPFGLPAVKDRGDDV